MKLEATQFVGTEDGWVYTFHFNTLAQGWSVMCRKEESSPIPTMTKMWTDKGWVHSLRKVGGNDVYYKTVDDAVAAITNPEDQ